MLKNNNDKIEAEVYLVGSDDPIIVQVKQGDNECTDLLREIKKRVIRIAEIDDAIINRSYVDGSTVQKLINELSQK